MARRSPPRKVTYFKPVPPRLARGAVRLLTRTGLDWTHKYPAIAGAVASIGARQAYLDGELCGVRPDGVTSFSMNPVGVRQWQCGRARVLPVRSSPSRRRGSVPATADRAERAARRVAVGGALTAALLRSPGRARPGIS